MPRSKKMPRKVLMHIGHTVSFQWSFDYHGFDLVGTFLSCNPETGTVKIKFFSGDKFVNQEVHHSYVKNVIRISEKSLQNRINYEKEQSEKEAPLRDKIAQEATKYRKEVDTFYHPTNIITEQEFSIALPRASEGIQKTLPNCRFKSVTMTKNNAFIQVEKDGEIYEIQHGLSCGTYPYATRKSDGQTTSIFDSAFQKTII